MPFALKFAGKILHLGSGASFDFWICFGGLQRTSCQPMPTLHFHVGAWLGFMFHLALPYVSHRNRTQKPLFFAGAGLVRSE